MTAERSRFGPYELVSRLGAGGMAETFIAVRRGPGDFEQRVCLKRILPAFEEDADFVRLFLEEARIAATLRHANVVQVLDFGVAEGNHFMALELVDGVDLRALLRTLADEGETMTSGLVSYLAYEVSNALEYAHRADASGKVRGIVHRDISPSNVLLSTAGEVKLADFGIAKAMDQTHVTRSGTTKGKVPYMAPEYALSAEYDARSDLFSLGVTLYECLAGERPFDGATELDTMRRIQEGVHIPLGERLPTAPRVLVDAIERLIDSKRELRFANAAALQDALVDVAPPPTARRILRELVRRAHDAKKVDAGRRRGDVAYAETMAATPNGTMVLDEGSAQDGRVVPQGGDAETRTALPSEGSEDGDATELDRSTEEARRVADAETRALDAPGSSRHGDVGELPQTPPGASPSADRSRHRSRRTLLVVGAVAAGVAFGVTAVFTSGIGEREEELTTPSPSLIAAPSRDEDAGEAQTALPSGVEAPELEVFVAAVDAAREGDEAEATVDAGRVREAAMATRGKTGLKIGVLPWGEVFVDGRSRGNAPVEVELRPGIHAIRVVGPPGLEEQRRVRVTSGRMREVQIRLH